MGDFRDILFFEAQTGFNDVNFLQAQTVDPKIIFGILGGIVFSLAVGVYCVYRYQKWRSYQAFVGEMQQLGLNPDQEGTFGDLVKRYKMKDPVEILYSLRMFDEMAALEMDRVLGSPGSMSAKQEFVNTLYEIRQITYMSEGEEDEGGQLTDSVAI